MLPLLAAWETSRVSVLVSHADRDHCSALARIATRVQVESWAGPPPRDCGVTLPSTTHAAHPESGRTTWDLANGTRLVFEKPRVGHDNEASASLWIERAGERLLLTGDAEGDALDELVDRLEGSDPLTLLLLPHHGSDGPHFGRLLDAARPREVWVSASRLPVTRWELERRGLTWRCTARDGPLRFEGLPGPSE